MDEFILVVVYSYLSKILAAELANKPTSERTDE